MAFLYLPKVMRQIIFLAFFFAPIFSIAQGSFAPDADTPGTTAIAADSSVFTLWATNCEIVRGYEDIAVSPLVEASFGEASNAIGEPGTNGLVSLGDGGMATLTFSEPIGNGNGWDFAVFENSFSNTFLELGFVEVSSDGTNYTRFPSISEIQTDTQVDGFGETDATMINNFAGKYRALFGTPFDLEELVNTPNLDITAITHVRIIDVVGSIQTDHATYDSEGTIINDPYPTPFVSSGFDLDAVGIIHTSASLSIIDQDLAFRAYPNPALDILRLQSINPINTLEIYSITGELLINQATKSKVEIDISGLPKGNYILKAISDKSIGTKRLTKM